MAIRLGRHDGLAEAIEDHPADAPVVPDLVIRAERHLGAPPPAVLPARRLAHRLEDLLRGGADLDIVERGKRGTDPGRGAGAGNTEQEDAEGQGSHTLLRPARRSLLCGFALPDAVQVHVVRLELVLELAVLQRNRT